MGTKIWQFLKKLYWKSYLQMQLIYWFGIWARLTSLAILVASGIFAYKWFGWFGQAGFDIGGWAMWAALAAWLVALIISPFGE